MNNLEKNDLMEELNRLRARVKELEAELALQGDVFKTASDGICLYALDGSILDPNPAFCRIVGYSRQEMLKKKVADLLHPDRLSDLEEFQRQIKASGEVWLESVSVREDKTPVPIEARVSISTHGGKPCLVGIFRDITERNQMLDTLRMERDRSSKYLDTAGVILVVIDADQKVSLINKKGREVLGCEQEKIIGKNWFDNFLPASSRDQVKAVFDKLMAGEIEPAEFHENLVLTKRGEERIIAWQNTVLRDDEGKIIGTLGSGEDITERRRAEEALRQSAEIINSSPAVAFLWKNAEGWPVEFVSENTEKTFGYSVEEFLSGDVPYVQIVHPDDKERVAQEVSDFSADDSLTAFRHEPYRIVAKDGTVRWIDDRTTIRRNAQGRITHYQGIVLDITKQMQAEERLRERENFFSGTLNDMLTFVAVLEPDGKIIFINNTALDIAGIKLKDLRGETLYDTFWWQYSEEARQTIKNDIEECRSKKILSHEIEIQIARGNLTWIDFSMHPIIDESGKVEYLVAEARDITEHKKAEEEKANLEAELNQAQKMEAVGRLAGGVAHDFNNMLSVIRGYAELMRQMMSPNDPLLNDLKEIEKAANRAADITRQLLAFSRKQVIAPKIVELNSIIADMKKMIARLIGEDIDILFVPGPDLWKTKVDPSQIDQIMANLAVNARDAMPDGGKLTIETANVIFDEAYCAEHTGFVPGWFVMLAVSDDGTGMDKETQTHIFEPFFTTKGEGAGTGLGLSTVYGIAKQNNGFVNVYSEPGQGTTFKVYLPISADEGKRAERPPEKRLSPVAGKILLAEDDEMVRNLAKAMLESIGYTVLAAEHPQDALTLCEKGETDIDLLLTDVIMPGMSGKELRDAIEALMPGIKTLFMSGYTANVIAHQGVLEEGINFIQKPFTRGDLAEKVKEALSK